MPVHFNHTLIAARDKRASARFFVELFGLPEPEEGGVFLVVRLAGGVLLQFAEPGVEFPGQHYAFLVDDDTFDGIMARIRERGITHWADPRMRLVNQVNTNHGGRGVYFDDPSGHHLEAITRPYSG
jgi:catechol 2,3-dioxygenase-like lactoylglutathione lyase family enzyme